MLLQRLNIASVSEAEIEFPDHTAPRHSLPSGTENSLSNDSLLIYLKVRTCFKLQKDTKLWEVSKDWIHCREAGNPFVTLYHFWFYHCGPFVCIRTDTSWQVRGLFACWHFGNSMKNEKNFLENVSNAKHWHSAKRGQAVLGKDLKDGWSLDFRMQRSGKVDIRRKRKVKLAVNEDGG